MVMDVVTCSSGHKHPCLLSLAQFHMALLGQPTFPIQAIVAEIMSGNVTGGGAT